MSLAPAMLTGIGSILGGIGGLMGQKSQGAPAPQAATPPPQERKAPVRQDQRNRAAAAGAGGTDSTLLTGPMGASMDASLLGRNMLLGQ